MDSVVEVVAVAVGGGMGLIHLMQYAVLYLT